MTKDQTLTSKAATPGAAIRTETLHIAASARELANQRTRLSATALTVGLPTTA